MLRRGGGASGSCVIGPRRWWTWPALEQRGITAIHHNITTHCGSTRKGNRLLCMPEICHRPRPPREPPTVHGVYLPPTSYIFIRAHYTQYYHDINLVLIVFLKSYTRLNVSLQSWNDGSQWITDRHSQRLEGMAPCRGSRADSRVTHISSAVRVSCKCQLVTTDSSQQLFVTKEGKWFALGESRSSLHPQRAFTSSC